MGQGAKRSSTLPRAQIAATHLSISGGLHSLRRPSNHLTSLIPPPHPSSS